MNDEHYSDRSGRVMHLANKEAQRFSHEYIGTEHVLLGLIAEGQGIGASVLKNLDIDLEKTRREVERIIIRGPATTYSVDKLPLTPRVKKAIEYAIQEARTLNHNYVGTEHLLLGLVREREGVAAQVLMNLGLTLDRIREEVLCLLGRTYTGPQRATAELSANLDDGPVPAKAIVGEFDFQIEQLQQEKEVAVNNADFEKAANLRDLIDKLTKLRSEFIRQWPKNV